MFNSIFPTIDSKSLLSIMSTNLDIRRILDLRANGQCEGTAVTKKGQPKCTKPINKADWLAACRLLNQMDRSEDIRHAVDDLEELAGLLLCNEWHNSLRRPQNSQVRKMYNKWEKFVNEEYLRLKNEEEREAEREEAERVRLAERKREAERERGAEGKREAERRAQRVADRRSIATRVMTKLEEERVRTVRQLGHNTVFKVLTVTSCRLVPLYQYQNYLQLPA